MSKVRANNFTNKAGTGAPTFPYGANVTGVVTTTTVSATAVSATTLSLSGNATVGGNLTVSGTQTIINTTSLEVEDINIGIASVTPALSDAKLRWCWTNDSRTEW